MKAEEFLGFKIVSFKKIELLCRKDLNNFLDITDDFYQSLDNASLVHCKEVVGTLLFMDEYEKDIPVQHVIKIDMMAKEVTTNAVKSRIWVPQRVFTFAW